MVTWIPLVCLVLILCVICGRFAILIGQSRVIGEIGAGVILGPMVTGSLFPEMSRKIITPEALEILQALGELGLIILMVELPWHSGIAKPECRISRGPVLIAMMGVVLSFSIGCSVGVVAKNSLAPTQPFLPFVLFCGIAASVTALPLLLRLIQDRDDISELARQTALTAAVYTDLFVWAALVAVITVQSNGMSDLFESACRASALAAYAAIAILILRPWLKSHTHIMSVSQSTKAGIALVSSLMSAQLTENLGFHHAIGAMIAAYVFYDVDLMRQAWERWVGKFGKLVLLPIFFACSMIQFSFQEPLPSDFMFWIVLFFTSGVIGKVAGSYIGARISGYEPKVSFEIGVLMNAKGVMELVLLNVGLRLGVLSEISYIALVAVSVVSILTFGTFTGMLKFRPFKRKPHP